MNFKGINYFDQPPQNDKTLKEFMAYNDYDKFLKDDIRRNDIFHFLQYRNHGAEIVKLAESLNLPLEQAQRVFYAQRGQKCE